MIKHALVALTLSTAALLSIGCEQQVQTPPGTVALVELDRIAKATGKDQEILEKLQTKQNELIGRANNMREQMQAQATAVRQQLGEEPTNEDMQQFQAMVGQMQQQLQSEQMNANYEMEMFRGELATQLRRELREPALAVAKQRGFSIVFETNEAIIAAVDAVDITDDVIKHMSTNGSASLDAKLAPPGQLPSLNLPSSTNTPPMQLPPVQSTDEPTEGVAPMSLENLAPSTPAGDDDADAGASMDDAITPDAE